MSAWSECQDNWREGLTLREGLRLYLHQITSQKKGAPQETNRIRQMMRHRISQLRLTALRGCNFAAYRDERQADGKAPSTVKNELAIFSHLYTVARQEWGFEQLANPMANVRKPKARPGRDRRLVDDEERRLLDAAGYPMQDIIILAIETAMRLSELLALQWKNVDLRQSVAVLVETKNGERRAVPLSRRAYKTIKRIPRRLDGRVFPPAAVSTYSHRFKDLCKAAGIKGLRFHDLRHEAISRLFELGRLNVMEIAAITGHKTLTMLKRYTHPRAEDLARKLSYGGWGSWGIRSLKRLCA